MKLGVAPSLMGSPIGNINGESIVADLIENYQKTGSWWMEVEVISVERAKGGNIILFEAPPLQEGLAALKSSGFATIKDGKVVSTEELQRFARERGLI